MRRGGRKRRRGEGIKGTIFVRRFPAELHDRNRATWFVARYGARGDRAPPFAGENGRRMPLCPQTMSCEGGEGGGGVCARCREGDGSRSKARGNVSCAACNRRRRRRFGRDRDCDAARGGLASKGLTGLRLFGEGAKGASGGRERAADARECVLPRIYLPLRAVRYEACQMRVGSFWLARDSVANSDRRCQDRRHEAGSPFSAHSPVSPVLAPRSILPLCAFSSFVAGWCGCMRARRRGAVSGGEGGEETENVLGAAVRFMRARRLQEASRGGGQSREAVPDAERSTMERRREGRKERKKRGN